MSFVHREYIWTKNQIEVRTVTFIKKNTFRGERDLNYWNKNLKEKS